jgi:hypothetical protein
MLRIDRHSPGRHAAPANGAEPLLHPALFGGIDFMFVAIGVSIVVRAIRGGGRRRFRDLPPQQPVVLEDPRVPQLMAELDELRTHVDRLNAAESFYAQLNAPSPQGASQGAPPAAPAAGPPQGS